MKTPSLKDRLAGFLQNTQTEIDEMRVQMTLGKMEAADVFENMKKELREQLLKFPELAAGGEDKRNINLEKLRAVVDELKVQLTLGRAEARDAFHIQQEKINRSIDSLEHAIRNGNYGLSPDTNLAVRNELYKFKLKTDLLKIKFEIGKLELKQKAGDTQQEMKEQFNELIEKLPKLKEDIADSLIQAGDGLQKVYGKLKKAFD
jgi:hypothetical protein